MILCAMQFAPSPTGNGGQQRAWHILRSLAAIGPVHFLLIRPVTPQRPQDIDVAALEGIVSSAAVISLPEWSESAWRIRRLPSRIGGWLDLFGVGPLAAPRFTRRTIDRIAREIPQTDVDVVFAGRLPLAIIMALLIRYGHVRVRRKVVDFDDILSKFFERELASAKRPVATDRFALRRLTIGLVKRAETRIIRDWDGVSVCSEEDHRALANAHPNAAISTIPNVVDKPQLGPPPSSGFTLLFVGNLGFAPNEHGLKRFLEEAWPIVRRHRPEARLVVVGLNPRPKLRAAAAAAGAELHADVPSVLPYYEAAHAVIAPIFFGGGTRIKILEAMAFGRPVVSTPIGAEGLGLVPGRHALIAESMSDFATAIVSLARDPELRARLAEEARLLQQDRFSERAMATALRAMVLGSSDAAPPHPPQAGPSEHPERMPD